MACNTPGIHYLGGTMKTSKLFFLPLTVLAFNSFAAIEDGSYNLESCLVDDEPAKGEQLIEVEVKKQGFDSHRSIRLNYKIIYARSQSEFGKSEGSYTIPVIIDINKDNSLQISRQFCDSQPVQPIDSKDYSIYHLECGGWNDHYKVSSVIAVDKKTGKVVYAKANRKEERTMLRSFDIPFLSLKSPKVSMKQSITGDVACKEPSFAVENLVPVFDTNPAELEKDRSIAVNRDERAPKAVEPVQSTKPAIKAEDLPSDWRVIRQ